MSWTRVVRWVIARNVRYPTPLGDICWQQEAEQGGDRVSKNRNGAPSREACAVNVQVTMASNM